MIFDREQFLVPVFLCFFLLYAPILQAKDSALIVFDASGSMWGKIKETPKIEIARDVMGTLVKDWNEDIELGLIAYGHREKGNCRDIELLMPVATVDDKKILKIINDISPIGKTPLSESLKQAAEILRYTEDPATVILISDGEETCHADPCAVSKELEAQGIHFTAHVIGFDIKKNKKAQDQLKCIAKNTGGQFYEAEDAASLKKALINVKKKIEKPSLVAKITLIAIDSTTNQIINGATEWNVINVSTEALKTLNSKGGRLLVELVEGEYEVFATVGNQSGDGKISVTNRPDQKYTIKLGEVKGTKVFNAPSSISAGEVLKFDWNGPNSKDDMIFIMKPNAPDNQYYRSREQRHKVEDGSPAVLTAPSTPGSYEIRYYSYNNGSVLSRAALEVSDAKVNIDMPAELPAGKVVDLSWVAPNATGDMIFFADKGMKDSQYPSSGDRRIRTDKETSGQLVTPAKLGEYDVRYYSYNNGDVLARFPFTVVKSEVTLNTPRIVSVGSTLEFEWQGPNAPGDLLFIAKPDMAETKYYYGDRQSARTSKGSPAKLTIPAKKGTYEIRYYSKSNGEVLARRALIVR